MKQMSRNKWLSPAAAHLQRLSPTSARTVARLLDNAATALSSEMTSWQSFDWCQLDEDAIRRLRGTLEKRYSVSTVNATLTAVRGVLREACRQGLMPAGSYLAAAEVPGPSREDRPDSVELDAPDITKLLDACRQREDPISARDMAVIALLYGAGLTSSEIVELDTADLDLATGSEVVDPDAAGLSRSVTVRGRGVKYCLGNEALQCLRRWLSYRGDRAGPLFLGVDKGRNLLERRLGPQLVHDLLAKRAKQAQLNGVTVSAIRRLANRQRTLRKLQGWPDVDSQGRILCLL